MRYSECLSGFMYIKAVASGNRRAPKSGKNWSMHVKDREAVRVTANSIEDPSVEINGSWNRLK